MRLNSTLIPAAAMAVLLSACDLGPSAEPAPSPQPQPTAVQVTPAEVTVAPGASTAFAATATGSAAIAATWSVVEQGGGTIDTAGVYTAPSSPGTFHVRATAGGDPQVYGEAVVTVRPGVAVAVTPTTATVVTGGTRTFTASVTNATNGAVTWSVAGTSCGSITQAGVYTAPSSPATCTVVAASQEDPAKRATATVTVTAPAVPVAVAVTPSNGATNSCKTLTFAASVTGASDGTVTWSVQEGAQGGTITSAGVYTAPATAGTYHVVATSRADATKRAISTVTVTDKVLSVAVTPAQATVTAGGKVQFTATVTTTCGSFTASQTVAAPAG